MGGGEMTLIEGIAKLLGPIAGKHGDWMEAPNHNECLSISQADGERDLICWLNAETPSDQVWLGLSNKWIYFYSGSQFRKMAIWTLWRWAWSDWFGLRTRIWMWCLTNRNKVWKDHFEEDR